VTVSVQQSSLSSRLTAMRHSGNPSDLQHDLLAAPDAPGLQVLDVLQAITASCHGPPVLFQL
jgi:hypothetical protein